MFNINIPISDINFSIAIIFGFIIIWSITPTI